MTKRGGGGGGNIKKAGGEGGIKRTVVNYVHSVPQ